MALHDVADAVNGLPVKGDLRKAYKTQPLPTISAAALVATASDDANEVACTIFNRLNLALASNDAEALQSLFLNPTEGDSYWKDQLILTSHLRTFHGPRIIAANFTALAGLRGIEDGFKHVGTSMLIPVGPTLSFIDSRFQFTTRSPSAAASGRLMLVPVGTSEGFTWKIWIMSTWMEGLKDHPENIDLLKALPTTIDIANDAFKTEVFVIGGGNAAAALSARLKALNVECVVAERNASVGDNWNLRYDGLKFHVPTSFCTMPYLEYPKELQHPHLLSNKDLAAHLNHYVNELNLNFMTQVKINHTEYNKSTREWTVRLTTPQGEKIIIAKHLVLATGVGSQKPNLPSIANRDLYKGHVMHSQNFKNGNQLKEQGVKSVLVVGSANTAFDVIESLSAADIPDIKMNVRSPTYLCPLSYVCDPRSLGAYDRGVQAGDENFMTIPSIVDGQLGKGLFGFLASQEPERYKSLTEAGFPVVDSLHPDSSLMHNLIERAGGHYVETGGHELIVQGKVAVKALVEPVAYTESGVKFSDGSTVDVDAVIWCTGFADANIGDVALEILGGKNTQTTNGNEVEKSAKGDGDVLGPAEIASRIESTWGIDADGEIRGLWKRHAMLDDNFWIMGGYTQQHRWHSRTLALQIKAALEGILPEAYRGTLTAV